jgi:hypothetical protein
MTFFKRNKSDDEFETDLPWLNWSADKRITEDLDWRDEEDDPIEDEDQDSEESDSEFKSTRSRYQKLDRSRQRKKRKFT